MFATMHLWWAEDLRVPEFIKTFDNAQTKAPSASLQITDNWLTSIATSNILLEKSLPNNSPSWDGLVPSAQTCTAWKIKFVLLHSAM